MSLRSPLITRLLRRYVRPHLKKLAQAVGCMLLVAGTTAGNAWLMQPVLDEVFINRQHSMLLLLPGIVAALAVVKAVASYGQSVLMLNAGQSVVADMQRQLYNHLIDSDLALFHTHSTGTLISRFTYDITLMRDAASRVLTTVAREFVTFLALVGVMIYQSPTLSFIALLVFPVAAWPLGRLAKRMRKIARVTQEHIGELTAHLDESFQGIRIIKAYGAEGAEKRRAAEHVERIFSQYVKSFRVKSAASPLMEMLAGFAVAAVIWYGGAQVISGETTPGAFFSFIAALVMAYKPAKNLAGLNTNLQEALAAAQRVFEMLDHAPAIQDRPGAVPLAVSRGEISVERVSFAYNEAPVLREVSFSVPPGAKVALVGPSGSGKSTLVNLLLRFYEPGSGGIAIDGQDITQVTLSSLRSATALVTQETILFDDTVRANLCYGRQDVPQEKMIAAARAAEAHEFIEALPQGYDTPIGQHGVRLSGGQRQRLAIARAMLKDAPILLLDEATSALDPIAEKKIQGALARLMEGRTSLIIAHRLSTIQDADVIHVLEEGRIAESGTHAELLAKQGLYAELYARQN